MKRAGLNDVPPSGQKTTSLIRLAAESDAAAIAELYRPIVETTSITFELEPPDEEEMSRRVRDTLLLHPWLVCELDGDVAGYAYATKHRARAAYRWSVDVSVYVRSASRGQGVGHGLYLSLFAVLRAQGYINAYAGIALPNPASVGLHERVGFQPLCVYQHVGYKFGEWRDVGWWQLMIQPAAPSPREPAMLQSLQDNSGWPELLSTGLSAIRHHAA
jgi:L-amino acid N-acyltransferase YncA